MVTVIFVVVLFGLCAITPLVASGVPDDVVARN